MMVAMNFHAHTETVFLLCRYLEKEVKVGFILLAMCNYWAGNCSDNGLITKRQWEGEEGVYGMVINK